MICIVIIILRWEIAGGRRIATYVSYCSAVELFAVSVEMVDAHCVIRDILIAQETLLAYSRFGSCHDWAVVIEEEEIERAASWMEGSCAF